METPVPLLNNGDAFPKLTLPAVGGGSIALPAAFAGSWGVVIIYRGAWCPFCNAQLAGFAAEKEALDGLGIKVVALSVDDEAASAGTVAKTHLQFPVGYSADADAVAGATGAFVNSKPRFLQPASFVLAPDGTVKAAVYATSAIGRMTAKDVVGFVGYLKSVAAKAAAAE
jgi:peroxiredoxin